MTEGSAKRVALIGCGRWGRNIARVLSELGALELIVDPDGERLSDYAAELGARISTDIEDALAAAIGAVVIAAPAVDHATLARKFLHAGKPVYVEKPLALDVDDARELAEIAEAAGLTLMVGHLLQYHPAYVTLKRLVRDGAIGELRHVTSHRLNPGAIRTEENALWSMGPHDFSMILGLVGSEPSAVASMPVRVIDPAIPDQFFVQMQFPDGKTAQASVSWISPYKEHKLTVLGTKGALVFEDTASERERKLVLYRNYVDRSGSAPRFVKSAGEPVEWPNEEPLRNEMQAFLDAIDGEDSCRTGPDEAIPVLRLLHAAETASRS